LPEKANAGANRLRAFRIFAVCASVIAALALSEVLFRVCEIRPPTHSPPPDHQKVDDHRNTLGLRERWDRLDTSDKRLRIAFLGDSFTFGESVEPEETFVRLVEPLLVPTWPSGVVTINVGLPGTGPGKQVEKYLEVRQELCPEVLVHVIYVNDIGAHLADLVHWIHSIRDSRLWLGTWSYVLRYAEAQIRYVLARRHTDDFFHGGHTVEERRAAWGTFARDVARCKAAAEEGGAKYCVVLFPWISGLDHYPLTDLHQKILRLASELGVPFVDLLEVFTGLSDASLRISSVDEHPNPEGHRLAARRIALFLTQEVIPNLPSMERPCRSVGP